VALEVDRLAVLEADKLSVLNSFRHPKPSSIVPSALTCVVSNSLAKNLIQKKGVKRSTYLLDLSPMDIPLLLPWSVPDMSPLMDVVT
jgi:hypothetical protein